MKFPDPVERAAEMAKQLHDATASLQFDDYLSNRLVQAASEMMLIHLGTALGRMRHLGIRHSAQAQASTLFQLRTYLMHSTRDVDNDRVWDAIRNTVPVVLAVLPTSPVPSRAS